MKYELLYNTIQSYAENTESLFVANIPVFVQEAENRIYNSVQIPSLRKNVTGVATGNNPYISLPSDYLASFSVAVIDQNGNYNYLLNKDANYIREVYPNPTATGVPRAYALFGPQFTNINNLSYIVGPTPDQNYNVELHYFYYPPTIVQGQISALSITTSGVGYINGLYQNVPFTGGSGANASGDILVVNGKPTSVTLQFGGNFYLVGDVLSCASIGNTGSNFTMTVTAVSNAAGESWLGDNYDPVLLYGAMREAIIFMKGEADMVKYYEDKYQEAIGQLARLSAGLERGDTYRDGQAKIKVGL